VPFVQELDGSVQMQFTQTGNYIISTILETGCGMMSGEFQVQIGENPYPDLGPDMNICEGTSLLLTPGEGFEDYLWSDASDGETLEIGAPGTYSVTVMEAGGCSISDEIIIGEEIVAEIDLGVDIEVCEDVILLDAGDDFADYLWQDGWTESTYTVFEPGTYWVTTTLPCFASDTIVISDCHGDGIEDLYSTLDFTLFPNPAESELSVLLTDNWSGQVVLYDQLGKLVLRRDIANETGFTISLNVLSAGVYTVTLRDDKSVGRRTLVVK
jgi:hypothetical protein